MKEDYVDLIVFDRSLPFYIDLAGISYCDGNFFVRRPQSTVSSIEYIISGTGTVKTITFFTLMPGTHMFCMRVMTMNIILQKMTRGQKYG